MAYSKIMTRLCGAAFARPWAGRAACNRRPVQTVDYIVYAPSSSLQDFTPFTRCRARSQPVGRGSSGIVRNATLTQPLARMVDPSLTQGMVEYVVGHVLALSSGPG